MAIREIRTSQDEILSKKSRDVLKYDKRLHLLLDDLADTLHEANGAGLAAVQVGVLRRCAVVDIGQGIIEFVNPKVVDEQGEQISLEGCLSFSREYGITKRPKYVKIEAKDRNGEDIIIEGEGLLAKALMHEVDHLNGKVFKQVCIRMLTDSELEEYLEIGSEREDEFIKEILKKV